MIGSLDLRSQAFPKSARLLKSRDFRFRPYQRMQKERFNFFFTPQGKGRLGISISKKVLRNAVARNRVRRLLREAFRLNYDRFQRVDLHVVGLTALTSTWKDLDRETVERDLLSLIDRLS